MAGEVTLTGVSSHFSAAHRDKRGRLHGHTWEVTAWFPRADATELQTHLKAALRVFDHRELPENLSEAEDILPILAINMPKAVEIEISRRIEGIHARWRKECP